MIDVSVLLNRLDQLEAKVEQHDVIVAEQSRNWAKLSIVLVLGVSFLKSLHILNKSKIHIFFPKRDIVVYPSKVSE